MRPRLRALVALGGLYVVLKWALILTAGAWFIERGHTALLLVFPVLFVSAALIVRASRRSSPGSDEAADD